MDARWTALSVWFGAVVGCAPSTGATRETVAEHAQVTPAGQQRFWVFGDAQLNSVAARETRTHAMLTDSLVSPTSIRPPTLDLWSETLLLDVIAQTRREPDAPVFFVGDAANTSCTHEFARFLTRMRGTPWFGALGNHDGYYMGNLTFAADAGSNSDSCTRCSSASGPTARGVNHSNTWQGACEDGDPLDASTLDAIAGLEHKLLLQPDANSEQCTLTKAVAIWMYLADLTRRVHLDRDPLAAGEWKRHDAYHVFSTMGTYELAGRRLGLQVFAGVGARPPGAIPSDTWSQSWAGYLLQDIELPDGEHALLLDTSDFEDRPPSTKTQQLWAAIRQSIGLSNGLPGEWGHIGPAQADQLARLAREARTKLVLFGHHDWQSLDASRSRLEPVLGSPAFGAYFSGHQHYRSAAVAAGASSPWEINVASIVDAPRQFLHVAIDTARTGEPSRLALTVEPAGWTSTLCFLIGSEDDELDYGTVRAYTSRALDVYAALFRMLATTANTPNCNGACLLAFAARIEAARSAGDKVATSALRELLAESFRLDRNELMRVPAVADRERSCAIWASELEASRLPDPVPTVMHAAELVRTSTVTVWATPARR